MQIGLVYQQDYLDLAGHMHIIGAGFKHFPARRALDWQNVQISSYMILQRTKFLSNFGWCETIYRQSYGCSISIAIISNQRMLFSLA